MTYSKQKSRISGKSSAPGSAAAPGQVARSREKRPAAAAKGAERLLGGPGGEAPRNAGVRVYSNSRSTACLRATLHHVRLILVITTTCQSLVWNNTPSLSAHFGDWPGAWARAQLGPGPAWARARLGSRPCLGPGPAWAWAWLAPGPGLGLRPGLGPGPAWARARLGSRPSFTLVQK